MVAIPRGEHERPLAEADDLAVMWAYDGIKAAALAAVEETLIPAAKAHSASKGNGRR